MLKLKYDHPSVEQMENSWKFTAHLLVDKIIPILVIYYSLGRPIHNDDAQIILNGLTTIQDIFTEIHMKYKPLGYVRTNFNRYTVCLDHEYSISESGKVYLVDNIYPMVLLIWKLRYI